MSFGTLQAKDLQARLDTSLGPFCNLRNHQDFVAASQSLSDSLQGFFVLLTKSDVNVDSWVWILVLNRFTECGMHISSYYKQYQKTLEGSNANLIDSFNHSFRLILKYLESFFRIYQPTPGNPTDNKKYYTLVKQTISYITSFLGILDLSVLIRGLALSVSTSMAQDLLQSRREPNTETRMEICRLVTKISKISFFGGCSSAILPLVFNHPACISENFILPMIGLEQFDIELLIDYLRYSAFCMVSSVAELESIDDQICKKADIFFKILLNLPNLQLTNYALDLEKNGDFLIQLSSKYVSFAEREELSFFYLLNYLFKLGRLEALTDTEKYFKNELSYFIESFNNRAASELDQLASVPLSRNTSSVFVPRLAEPVTRDMTTNLTLSSILYDGSYKERLKLVVDFFTLIRPNTSLGSISRLVQAFDMSQSNSLADLLHSSLKGNEILNVIFKMQVAKCPGKFLYLKAVDKIVRLVQLLTLKFCICTMGSAQSSDQILQQIFESNYTLAQITLVKSTIILDLGDSRSQLFNKRSEDEKFSRQLRMIERTKALEQTIQRLF